MGSSYKTISDRLGRGELAIFYDYSQDQINNRTLVTITGVSFCSYIGYGNYFGDGVINFNGAFSVNYTNDSASGCYCGGPYEYQPLGSKSFGSFYVNHDSSGRGSFSITVGPRSGSGYSDFNVFCSQGTSKNCAWTAGGTSVSLPQIDRTAPTVSLSASAVSSTSAKITVSASVACDYWWYSVDGGEWVAFAPSNNQYTITGLSSATHTLYVAARKTSNQVIGYSSGVSVDIVPPSITLSLTDVGTSSLKINASANVNCSTWQYKVGSGSWTTFKSEQGTSGEYTLTGLSPNTQYTIQVRATKVSNSIVGTSSSKSATTLGGSVLNSASNFASDAAEVKVPINVTVYGTFYHRLRFKRTDGTLITSVTFQLSAMTSTNIQISLGASTRTTLLNAMPNVKNLEIDLVLETYSDSEYTTMVGSSGPKRVTMTTSAALSSPTFTNFTYRDTESAVTAITQNNQILLQTFSHLLVNAVAGTAKNGSSITGYSVSIGDISMGATGTTLDVGSVSSSGDLTLRVTCSDSRGYYTSVEKTVKVLAYSSPSLSSFTLRRRNEIDSLVQLMFSGRVSTIPISDTEKNALVSVTLKYKKTSESESAWVTQDLTNDMTISGLMFSYSNLELVVLDETLSYDFLLIVRDNLGTLSQLEYQVILNQGTPLLAFRKRSQLNNRPRIGVNNPSPQYEFDVHGDIAMHDVLVLGFVAELTTEYLNSLQYGGYYTQSDASEAQTSRNYPVAKAGLLEILANGSGYVVQRYIPFDMTSAFFRCYNGSSWTSWKSITMS